MPEPDDAALLQAHLAGDPHAFEELVHRYRNRLWAVAFRTLGDRDDAADAVQEAFLSAFRAARSFRGESKVGTWLHRIAVNACLDIARHRRSRPATPVPAHELASLAAAAEDPDTTWVTEALRRLPAEQAAALVLVDLQGYAVADAAEMLQVPEGTVKSRCARARARLAGYLAESEPRRNPGGAGAVGTEKEV